MEILSLFNGCSGAYMALNELGIHIDKYYVSEIDKFANKAAKAIYPESIFLGDVTKWREWDIEWNEIDLIAAGSPCFVSDTKVLTSLGYKRIEDVKVSDMVLTHNNKWKEVLNTGGQTKKTIRVKSQGMFPISTTENHPFYVRRMKRKWDNSKRCSYRHFESPEWINAGDLSKDDFLAMPIIHDEDNIYNLSHDECFVLGRYIAYGHTSKKYRISEGRPNHRYWQLILSIGNKKYFDTSLNYGLYKHTKNVERMVFSNKRLVEIAESECGCGAKNKKIGVNLLKLPKSHLKALLSGIESGDGYVRGSKVKITSISKELIQSIQLAVAKVYNVGSNITHTKRPSKTIIEGRVVNQNDTYEVQYNKIHQKQDNYFIDENHIWYRYKSTDILENDIVYNIEVDGDNSYIVENCVVHNCQGFSFAGKQLAFDDPRSALFFEFIKILDYCKKVNPNVYFFLENVDMKKEHMRVINEYLGIAGQCINSNLVSAQNRKRWYWTNTSYRKVGLFGDKETYVEPPKDRGILLKDVLQPEDEVDEKYYIKNPKFGFKGLNINKKSNTLRTGGSCSQCNKHNYDIIKVDKQLNVKPDQSKASCFTAGGNHSDMDVICVAMRGRNPENPSDRTTGSPTEQRLEAKTDGKTNCITSVQKDNLILEVGSVRMGRTEEAKAIRKKSMKNGKDYSPFNSREITGVDYDKSSCILANPNPQKDNLLTDGYRLRRLTPLETMRLQTLPEKFQEILLNSGISDTQLYKMMGNGWNIETIKLYFKELRDEIN